MSDWLLLAAVALAIAYLMRRAEAAPPARQTHLFDARPDQQRQRRGSYAADTTRPADNLRFGPLARALAKDIAAGRERL